LPAWPSGRYSTCNFTLPAQVTVATIASGSRSSRFLNDGLRSRLIFRWWFITNDNVSRGVVSVQFWFTFSYHLLEYNILQQYCWHKFAPASRRLLAVDSYSMCLTYLRTADTALPLWGLRFCLVIWWYKNLYAFSRKLDSTSTVSY